MSTLERITTDYVEREDRIRVSGELADGRTVVLWLTQRLLGRLLPVLFNWLQGQGADTLQAELLHSFAQQAARAELVPQPPVQASDSSPAWLVLSVDIVLSAEGVRLTFKGAQDQQASLALGTLALRQWLGIVYEQVLRGQWPTTAWPAWMQEARPEAIPSAAALH